MDHVRQKNEPLALVPVEAPPADELPSDATTPASLDEAPAPAPGAVLTAGSDNEFLSLAAKEYREGQIDQPLWARALAQSSDDESQAVAAYLRSRATVLQLEKQERRRARQARRAAARERRGNQKLDPKTSSAASSSRASGPRSRALHLNSKLAVAVVTATLASVVAAGWWVVAAPGESPSSVPQSASAPARSVVEPVVAVAPKPSTAATAGVVKETESVDELKATMQRLKDAGNWNVFVLYASKWTRDEPANAAAWTELSTGYAKLNQFDDALFAASKAAGLSPENVELWRSVGHLNLALERLPEAGSAFEKVLAANANDGDALCGTALAAHRLGKIKDAAVIVARVKSAGGSCQDLGESESVAVVVKAPSKSQAPVGR